MNVKSIKLFEISVGTRRVRSPEPSYVAELARSMADMGQTTPIEVRKAPDAASYILVAGGHRLAAAKQLGWATISAGVLDCSERQARIREIEENLMRRELSFLARAICLMERKELYEIEFPQARHGGDRTSEQVATVATCSDLFVPAAFALDAGELLGVGDRTIRDWIKVAKSIHPEAALRLMDTTLADDRKELLWLGQNVLRDQQVEAIEEAFAGSMTPSQLAAFRTVALSTEDTVERQVTSVRNRFEKADPNARRRFTEWLYESGHLDGWIARGPSRAGAG